MQVKKYLGNTFFLFLSLAIFPSYGAGQFIEPQMIDYTNYPIFQLNTQKPNIMIILDNSGSMNYNAYGAPMKNGGDAGSDYVDPTECGIRNIEITVSAGDVEDYLNYYSGENDVRINSDDLELGTLIEGGSVRDQIVGIHFKTVDVPWNREIVEATLKFTPIENSSDSCSLTLYGRATGNAPEFTMTYNELKN